jgi:dipeptidyl aminopeptidase/acylaminoacyl peptidase
VLDKTVQKDVTALEKTLGDGYEVTNRTLDDSVWTVVTDDAQAPAVAYLYERKSGAVTKLFDQRPALSNAPLVPMQSLELKARDGLTLVSYLSLPPGSDENGDGRPDSPVPMVLDVHGGPWGRDEYGFRADHQWLANRGYAVLSVNFRASTGFGKSFVNAGNKEWAGKMHEDLLDAVDWAVKEKITTADKVAIYGGSYGGYATLAGLTFTPDRFACGVDIVGPSNLNTLLASIPAYWKSFFEELALRVGDPRTEEGKKLLVERSPLTHAAAITKPLLIGQGANDPRVNQAESDQIVNAMKAKNIPVTYVLFPDEGHGFARPNNRTAFNAVAEGFLSQCLGGRYEPIGNDFKGSSITVPEGAEHVPGLTDSLK